MDNCLGKNIEIKKEIVEDNEEIDDVFEENQPIKVLQPKKTNNVNLPVNTLQPKPSIIQAKPSILPANSSVLQAKPSKPSPEIKCMVELCPTKGRSLDSNYFCLTKQRYDSWLKALGEDPSTIKLDANNPYKYLVCQRHFRQCDFRGRLQKINDDAVPSLNLPRKAEIVKVAPHQIAIIEDVLELDEQSQEVCFTVFQKLKSTDIPPGKNKLQQSALLCGISYHTMKKIIKSRKGVKSKKKSLVSAILQIEKLRGRVTPTLDFYYKQLRNYPSIKCTKKELLHWLKVTGVNFKNNTAKTGSRKEDTIKTGSGNEHAIIILSDDEVETQVENSNPDLIISGPVIENQEAEINAGSQIDETEIEKLIIDEEILEQEKNVQPLFVTVKEANLLNVLSEIYESFRIEGKTPSLDYYYIKVLEKTKDFVSKDMLKHWLEQLNIKYKENDIDETSIDEKIETDIKDHPKTELDVFDPLIEPKKEPETEENMQIEKLIIDQETLDQEKNVLPLFITVKEVNLLSILPKIYEPFRIEDKIPSFEYYIKTVSEVTKDIFTIETVKNWLDQLNIKYENEQVHSNDTEMPLTVKSALHTIYNLFYKENVCTNLPSLEYIYDNLQKLVEGEGIEFSKGTLVEWIRTLSLKFKINEDIISPPSLAYFESQLILREQHYSKETLSTCLKHLKIHFKEQDSIEILEEPKELSVELQNLLVKLNKEFYKASPTSRIDSTIIQLLTDIEYRFHNLGKTVTIDNYHKSLIRDAGITCSKTSLANWLNILGIQYSSEVSTTDENNAKILDNKPTLDYFFNKLGGSDGKSYTKENLRYWLKQLKIDINEDPHSLMNKQHALTLPPSIASKLKTINMEFYSSNKQQSLDDDCIDIINSIVEQSGAQPPCLQHIHEQLSLNDKYVTKETLKEYLTSKNIIFTTKNYQNSSLMVDITAAIEHNCRIPTLDYFYMNITSLMNIICSRKQLQKWLDTLGILYYPSAIEDGQLVINEKDLTSQIITFLLKLDRDYSQSSSAYIINILKGINNKFIEKGEAPTLRFIYNYLQSYRLFCDENTSYYSKDVLKHWLEVLKIKFIDDNSSHAEPSDARIPALEEFQEKFKELTGNIVQENQLAVWLSTLGLKFKINSQSVPVASTTSLKLSKKVTDILKRANREILLNNLNYQLKEIEWSLMLQNQKPKYSHLVHIIESFNVFDQVEDPLNRKKVYKEYLTSNNIRFTTENDQYSSLVDDITAAIKHKYPVPTLDYFYINITSLMNITCSRKQLQKWLDIIGILCYPSTIEDEQLVIKEVDLTSQMITYLLKLDRDYPQSSSACISNILKGVSNKFIENGETPTLNFIYNYLQSYKLFCNENHSYYSKDVLRHWLKVLKIKFSDDNTTSVETSDARIPTLEEFHEKFKEITGNIVQENQLAVWLNTLGLKFKTNSQSVPIASTPSLKLTKNINCILTRANREILLNNLKFQLKEIEWTFMLQNQKPVYSHLARIIESFNVFDHIKNPHNIRKVHKEWLQEIGIKFRDDIEETDIDSSTKITVMPTDITAPSINSPQENVLKNPGVVLVKLTDLPTITVPNTTITTDFPELVISDVRSLNSSESLSTVEEPHSAPLNVTPQCNTEKPSPETEESFKPRKSFVDESFFKNIETEFISKGKIPSLKYIQDVLKENGLVFGESTLKKLLNSMDIKYVDENTNKNVENTSNLTVMKEIEEGPDNWQGQYVNFQMNTEITIQENESVVIESTEIIQNTIADDDETTTRKRKGKFEVLNPKKAKTNKFQDQLQETPTKQLNNIDEDLNNVIVIDEDYESIEIGNHKSQSELVNIEKTEETTQVKELPFVQIVDINKLIDNTLEIPSDHTKKIKSPTKPNQSASKCTKINKSDLVVTICTDVEHEFHYQRKTPTLDDFYLRILEKCGSQYDRCAIKKLLTKIGIKFKDK